MAQGERSDRATAEEVIATYLEVVKQNPSGPMPRVAELTGVPRTTCRDIVRRWKEQQAEAESAADEEAEATETSDEQAEYEAEWADEDGDVPFTWEQKGNGKRVPAPISDDEKKVQDATRSECIDDLREIAARLGADEAISRHRYRTHSHFAERAWNQHFGTFTEFKRQAGLMLSRGQHRFERDIAKHAAADTYRDMNRQKEGYEGKYLRPSGDRFQTLMICSDVHDIESDPFWCRVWLDTVRRVQPHTIVLGGDIFDLAEFGKYGVDPREWDVVGRIRWVHRWLQQIREASPDSQIDFIEGNHEFRLLRHLAEATPALKVVLSDLHGFTVPKLLGLDDFEINYISRTDLNTFTKADEKTEIGRNFKVYSDALLVSHYPQDRSKGLPGCNGHHHKHLVWHQNSPIFGPYEWHQLGGGHWRGATYADGEAWSNGFLLAHIDTASKSTAFEYVDVRDHAVVGGKWHVRADGERHGIIADSAVA